MLPVHARARHAVIEERLRKLGDYAEDFPLNRIFWGMQDIGIVASGIAYQYAREVFPEASFLKLSMTYPLPRNLIRSFASKVKRLIVIEELEPFLQEAIQSLGIKISGKEFIPRIGELSSRVVEAASRSAGLLDSPVQTPIERPRGLPDRPPLLCPGCPHAGTFFVLSGLGKRSILAKSKDRTMAESDLFITGDIGCYSLGANSPFYALDTNCCMGASIGQAIGMEKAGVSKKIVAVIGDSTFMHPGITGLVDAVYNNSGITVVILDNSTTAMTGHQGHPGTGISARGLETGKVELENLVRGVGVNDVRVVDAFDVKALRQNIRSALASPGLSVIIARGPCAMLLRTRSESRAIEAGKCDRCGVCFMVGCSAIRQEDGRVSIDAGLCVGAACDVCLQICPQKAIVAISDITAEDGK
jgi:indolepyruvate ferredoxin oxidoreductase alpha subunit